MKKKWNIGILLYNEVEVLDVAGPFEVLSITTYQDTEIKPFSVKTVAQTKEIIHARNGLKFVPDYSFEDAPDFDILIVPGGDESKEVKNEAMIGWLKAQFDKTELVAVVCTGAFLLAEAGLLTGKQATTHWMDLDRLEKGYPEVTVLRNVKFVDQGKIITAAGISAGINMTLYIVGKLLGKEVAKFTAKRMEYDIEL